MEKELGSSTLHFLDLEIHSAVNTQFYSQLEANKGAQQYQQPWGQWGGRYVRKSLLYFTGIERVETRLTGERYSISNKLSCIFYAE